MNARLWIGIAAVFIGVGTARGQQRLTAEIGEQVRKGVNRLTEDEVLKLVPGPVAIEMADGRGIDYILTWEEARRVRVEFSEGKVVSATGHFSDAVASTTLTPANFRKIAKGMTLGNVERILGGQDFKGDFSQRIASDAAGKSVFVCEWMQGRVIKADVKGGRVIGSAYIGAGE